MLQINKYNQKNINDLNINNQNLNEKKFISNESLNPGSDLNQEYDESKEESMSNSSINISNLNNTINTNNNKDFSKNILNYNNSNSNIDLFSSKSTNFASIIKFPNQYSEVIYENLYEKNDNNYILKNSIIISNDEEINKELYLKIIEEFYSKNLNNLENKNKYKICFLVIDSKKIDKLLSILNENFGKLKKIVILQGGKGKKMKNDYHKFAEFIQNADIFISIPDVFYKLLSIGFLKINQFSLLFIDDCHLCEGNHPYNILMQEFYYYYIYRKIYLKINNDYSLPIIIGFTDSPFFDKRIINNDNKCKQLLINISKNLDCQMIISPKLLSNNSTSNEDYSYIIYIQVENHLKNINIYEMIYKTIKHYFIEKMLKICLKNFLEQNQNFSFDKKNIETIGQKYLELEKAKFFSANYEEYLKIESNKNDLLFLSKNSYLFQIFEDMQKFLVIIIQNIDIQGMINFFIKYLELYQDILNQKSIDNAKLINELKYIVGIIKDTIKAFQHFQNVLHAQNIIFNNDRLIKFMSLLNKIYLQDKNSKTIIFVPSRKLAYVLNEYLNRNNLYKSEFIAGVNTKKDEYSFLSISPKITNNIINERNKKFNTGDADILICTPSIFDILQIIKCDCIIIFSELSNSKSDYIRIKNLAINHKSKLIIFTSDQNKVKTILMNKIIEHDNKLMKFFDINSIVKDFRGPNYYEEKIMNIQKQKYYIIEETQAKVSIRNSMILYNEINNWFLQQNQKIIINKFIEEYNIDKNKRFQCKIKLNEMFGGETISSDFCVDKQTSEAECLLILISFLHKVGNIIDDNLKIIDKFK